MNPIPVTLEDGHGLVRDQREANQLHSRGFVGTPLSGGGLRLEPVELAHLLLKGTVALSLKKGRARLTVSEFISLSSQEDAGFDTSLKVYRDIRDRGFFVKLEDKYLNLFRPDIRNTRRVSSAKVLCFHESEELELSALLAEAKRFSRLGITLLAAVADAEGDVTYFRLAPFLDEGEIAVRQEHLELIAELERLFSKKGLEITLSFTGGQGPCSLWSNHPQKKVEELLHQKLFLGKPFGEGLSLAWYEGHWLADFFVEQLGAPNENVKLRIVQNEFGPSGDGAPSWEPWDPPLYLLYTELKKKNMVPKTGFKYGSHFRAYNKVEEGHHAEYLVHLVEVGKVPWFSAELLVRMATGVRKEMVFAFPDEGGKMRFLKLTRELPSPAKE